VTSPGRCRHPKKDLEAALRYAEAAGWPADRGAPLGAASSDPFRYGTDRVWLAVQTCEVAHGSAEAVLWRPARRVRQWVIAALVPFAVVTVVGLVVLWPSHRAQPVPLQFTTYGEGRTVFEPGTVVGVSQRAFGGTLGSPTGPAGGPVKGSAAVCGTASVAVSSGPDAGRTVSLGPGDTSLRVGDRIRIARGPVTDPGTGVREYQFDDFVRDAPLGVIAALFAGLLFLVARWRGLAALAGVGVAYLVRVRLPTIHPCGAGWLTLTAPPSG